MKASAPSLIKHESSLGHYGKLDGLQLRVSKDERTVWMRWGQYCNSLVTVFAWLFFLPGQAN